MDRDDNNMYAWISFWAIIGLVILSVYYACISYRIKRYWLFLLFCTIILSLLNITLIVRTGIVNTLIGIFILLIVLIIDSYYIAKAVLSDLKRYDTFIVPASLLIITIITSLIW